jgi:hypothetical protein
MSFVVFSQNSLFIVVFLVFTADAAIQDNPRHTHLVIPLGFPSNKLG